MMDSGLWIRVSSKTTLKINPCLSLSALLIVIKRIECTDVLSFFITQYLFSCHQKYLVNYYLIDYLLRSLRFLCLNLPYNQFDLYELEIALLDGQEVRLKAVWIEFCESENSCGNCRWRIWKWRRKIYCISVKISSQRNNWFRKCKINFVFLFTKLSVYIIRYIVLTRIGTTTRGLTVVETEWTESVAGFGNSNLLCSKLSEFSILETLTYTLSAPIVLVLLLSKLFLQSLNNDTKWLDWKVTYKMNLLCVFDTQNNNLVKWLLTH